MTSDIASIGPRRKPSEATAGSIFDHGLAASQRWGAGTALAIVSFLAVLVLTGTLDASAILMAARRVDASTILAVLALSLCNYGLRGLRWHLFSREIAPQVPFTRSLVYYLTGFAFLLTPAKIGEVVRLWLLKQRHAVPYPTSLGVLVLDRAADALVLAGFAAFGLLGQAEIAAAPWICLAALVRIGALTGSRRLVVSVLRLAHRLTRHRLPAVFLFLLTAHRTLLAMCRPSVLATGLLLSMLAWGAQIFGLWLLVDALGTRLDLAHCAMVFALATLVGGVGGAEATMIGLLALAGMTGEAAVTATLMSRLATIWFALLIGLALAQVVLGADRRQAALPERDANA